MKKLEVNPDVVYQFKYEYPNELKNALSRIEYATNSSDEIDSDSIFYDKERQGVLFLHFNKNNLPQIFLDFLHSSLKKVIEAENICDTDVFITDSWVTITNNIETVHQHWHVNSVLSGVYYVDVQFPDNTLSFTRMSSQMSPQVHLKQGSDNLISSEVERRKSIIYGMREHTITVETGDLVIFDSKMTHGVPARKSRIPRVSLAFNTWLTNMGNTFFLNELNTIEKQ